MMHGESDYLNSFLNNFFDLNRINELEGKT